jgi:hypothetical protein
MLRPCPSRPRGQHPRRDAPPLRPLRRPPPPERRTRFDLPSLRRLPRPCRRRPSPIRRCRLLGFWVRRMSLRHLIRRSLLPVRPLPLRPQGRSSRRVVRRGAGVRVLSGIRPGWQRPGPAVLPTPPSVRRRLVLVDPLSSRPIRPPRMVPATAARRRPVQAQQPVRAQPVAPVGTHRRVDHLGDLPCPRSSTSPTPCLSRSSPRLRGWSWRR